MVPNGFLHAGTSAGYGACRSPRGCNRSASIEPKSKHFGTGPIRAFLSPTPFLTHGFLGLVRCSDYVLAYCLMSIADAVLKHASLSHSELLNNNLTRIWRLSILIFQYCLLFFLHDN